MENNIKSIEIINKEFASELTARIDYKFGVDHIHTDFAGWYSYIPAKSLHKNRPLIMHHYRGYYFVVIPWQDMDAIKAGDISVKEYIDISVWSFGYYWGGGSMLGGAHWQTLENGTPGFTDIERIKRYMKILSCRGHRVSCGYMPQESYCASCFVEKCPFSKYAPKNEGASWENEVKEYDARYELAKEVKALFAERYGLKVVSVGAHTYDLCNVYVYYSTLTKDEVLISLPQDLMIKLLYYPEKFDIKLLATGFGIQAVIPFKFVKGGDTIPEQYKQISGGVQEFYDFWAHDSNFNWFKEKDKKDNPQQVESVEQEKRFGQKIGAFFAKLWNKVCGK